MGSLSIWHWLVVLLIVVLVFGTKRLKNIGQDVGQAVNNFKQAVTENSAKEPLDEASSTPKKPD